MPFAPECSSPFEARVTFWAIFKKFLLVSPLLFFRKCGFLVTFPKIAITWPFEHLWSRCLRLKPFQSLHFKCILIKDNAICATVLLGLLSEGIFLGDFWKISLGAPFALFQKMRVLGDLAKTAKTWPYGNFRSRFFAPKSSPVFALEVHTN